MKTFVLPVVLLLSCASLALADQVVLHSDEVLEGEIQAMTYRELTINQTIKGSIIPRQIDAWDVSEIVLDSRKNAPAALVGAMAKFRIGNFKEAIPRLESVTQNRAISKVGRQYAYWHLIVSYFNLRDQKQTANALKGIRQAYEDTFYLRRAFEIEYDLARSAGDAKVMTRVVKELKAKANQLNIKAWQQAAEMKEAELNEFKGQPQKALPIYGRYRNNKTFGLQAKLGEMRCLGALKKTSEASSKAKGILREIKDAQEDEKKQPPHPRLIMAAYNALGDDDLSKNKVKPAFMNFLRVALEISPRYPGCPEHEEAIAKAAMAVARYARETEDAEEKEVYSERAGSLLAELKANFGEGSSWVKQVEKAFGN